MKYRKFQDASIAEIGLGTWQLGSADWGIVNEQEAFGILDTYVQQGGNFIDTADVYGMGISETIIGKFLKATRQPLFIATKLGRRNDEPNGWPQNFSYDAMKSHVEDSLSRLGTSQLFLEQLHCIPKETMQEGKVFNHLRSLQQQGLIQHWGASVETAAEALLCLEQEGIASLQLIFNLFRQHIADEVFEKAARKNVAIIARVPLASGLLTGKFSEKTSFAKSDHRNYNANGEAFNAGETFSGIDFLEGLKMSREMMALLPEGPMSKWALRWILDHPEVATVIPGASKISQVNFNVEASDLQSLSTEVHDRLRQYYDQQIRSSIRGEV